jgi:hypothetical protein
VSQQVGEQDTSLQAVVDVSQQVGVTGLSRQVMAGDMSLPAA